MTANRWWVRLGARWIARVDSVKGQLGLVFQAMTGVSLASGALKYFGFDTWVIVTFLAAVAIGTPVYVKKYSEEGVWNQVERDRQDLSNNQVGPKMLMDDTLIAVGTYTAIHGHPPTDEEFEAIEAAVRDRWEDYRDGVTIDDP